jgi:hypothetical protein
MTGRWLKRSIFSINLLQTSWFRSSKDKEGTYCCCCWLQNILHSPLRETKGKKVKVGQGTSSKRLIS